MQLSYLTWSRRQYHHPNSESGDENEHQSLTGENVGASPPYDGHRGRPRISIQVLLILIFVIANCLLFLSNIVMISKLNASRCSEKERSSYSPIYDRLDIYRSESRHNFTNYWPDNKPSIFQLPPSPAVNEAWSRISNQDSIALNADEVRRLGYDPDTVWPAPKDEFGEDVYYGVVDVFHQIHCLNVLRQSANPAYYGDLGEQTKHTPLKWEDHMLHCQYAVLRGLMCNADIEVIVAQKFRGWPGLNINFASTKKCRNFEDILNWKEENSIVSKAPWSEWPDRPIIEQDPEGVLTPYGNHLGLEDWAYSQGIELKMPEDLSWQPTKHQHKENEN
ncbi:hypothetical protein BGW36DRAFT_431876 [Talaromyces proteolyticus]|uniref:Cyclochlorotine biosynthesis protein O n=1 Tax=Talaromyces proteolyticus TaxID=1131652 RepID=A0AAD4PVZ0_9EURO|nr:uncharacterized protein BGW36DRAFT_431876 [Talaromyces proteolyticus]KAH8691327.1 hypothetical protein BGW36DRAFT_431876 [Talaromyces proteolyticus]